MFLSIKDITVYYGKSMAIEGVSLEVAEGSVVSVIGANGAGKSTILRGLFGLVPLTSGEIRFKEAEITGGRTVDIVKRGIGLVPEGRQLFPYLSVQSNLKLSFLRQTFILVQLCYCIVQIAKQFFMQRALNDS